MEQRDTWFTTLKSAIAEATSLTLVPVAVGKSASANSFVEKQPVSHTPDFAGDESTSVATQSTPLYPRVPSLRTSLTSMMTDSDPQLFQGTRDTAHYAFSEEWEIDYSVRIFASVHVFTNFVAAKHLKICFLPRISNLDL
jgi:hypothetical protein